MDDQSEALGISCGVMGVGLGVKKSKAHFEMSVQIHREGTLS